MKSLRRLLSVLVCLAVAFAAIEAALRLQQYLGPFYDLEFNNVSSIPSEALHHTHAPREEWHLADAQKFGAAAGLRYTNYYDGYGVRLDPLCRRDDTLQQPFDILFLGDSLMEGYDLEHSIPRYVCAALNDGGRLRRSVRVLNAGTAGYSPSIYIVQAKLLVPQLRPDFVVVDIDETDMGDDYLRYRSLVARDDVARIVAVRSTAASRELSEGFLQIKKAEYPLYITRLLMRTYHTRLRHLLPQQQPAAAVVDPLIYSRDGEPDAVQRYAVEIAFFEARVDELVVTLSESLGGSDKILLAYHPQLHHLQADADGHLWNTFVSDTVGKVTARRGVAFYNATDDLRQAFGAQPAAYYWPNDTRLNFEGLAIYGNLLAQQLALRLQK